MEASDMQASDMERHDFGRLRAHYSLIIGQMPERFDSHKFILALARHDQPGYIAALCAYCDGDEPFKMLHRRLSAMLEEFPERVVEDGKGRSPDIFRNRNVCRRWRKVSPD